MEEWKLIEILNNKNGYLEVITSGKAESEDYKELKEKIISVLAYKKDNNATTYKQLTRCG